MLRPGSVRTSRTQDLVWIRSGMLRPGSVRTMEAESLVALLEGGLDQVVLIDSRSFVDFNSAHILEAINVNCSKLMKRRLQQDKVQIQELLQHSARGQLDLQAGQQVVVYDQNSSDPASLGSDSFLSVLLVKLERSFPSVHLLSGGFSEFSNLFPGLCEDKSGPVPSCMSQPCLPVSTIGPTRILPNLYLGCQRDALNKDLMQQNNISYVLNVSNTCPKPDFIPESHFLRVPVNDSFCEKILPWLDRSVDFIEKAKASNSRVLVHCLAGVSRSATIAIAYIMKRMELSLDEAYRFVKEKRPTISPNFNFLGQLLDFEKNMKSSVCDDRKSLLCDAPAQLEEAEPRPDGPSSVQPEPCVLVDGPEDLAQVLGALQCSDGPEDSARLKRSFSLDIKSYGEAGGSPAHRGFGEGEEFYKESSSKACQFSPVEEVSEQSTPEHSPDNDEVTGPDPAAPPFPVAPPRPPAAASSGHQLRRRGSVEETTTSFLLGLSRSHQQLPRPTPGPAPSPALKGWHSDILLGPVIGSASSLVGGWYLSSESTRFYSSYGCGHSMETVRRRSRGGGGVSGDSRRSWHEESSFEKQLKRRSCQMELGDGSAQELVKVASTSSFSGSMEVIQVS
ncbi:dual specificity protein phosphatase 16 isoform X4 [Austrofundulus limnaeus]|uniref:Dual specificity protein phosphatase 16 isoform X3 n=1 Tax=Austrofundulus limnaeus TaxID=52670 RepID=A0A2I4CUG0_AUSLI|nr:PREDICTED: dual specificity protein phosphatase 16 isoform X3 [Austrofundulus limnaeus]XP_013883624.1 PREDICTED: dual specificity protein phosphatase 16 isoform X4 [Austrofundulus limnaeus]